MRLVLTLLIALGLLLPRAGAVLAEMVGAGRVTICAGAELVTVTLARDGTPIEAELAEHPDCLAATAPVVSGRLVPPWRALRADRRLPLPSAQPRPAAGPWRGPPPERGPPRPA